jgi:hypothetical protein
VVTSPHDDTINHNPSARKQVVAVENGVSNAGQIELRLKSDTAAVSATAELHVMIEYQEFRRIMPNGDSKVISSM